MWFVLMAEEGVESFNVFSFWSDPIGEVGVIIYIKEPMHSRPSFNCIQTHNINDFSHASHLSPHRPSQVLKLSTLAWLNCFPWSQINLYQDYVFVKCSLTLFRV